jgi:amino acid adenylation domain-containing protein
MRRGYEITFCASISIHFALENCCGMTHTEEQKPKRLQDHRDIQFLSLRFAAVCVATLLASISAFSFIIFPKYMRLIDMGPRAIGVAMGSFFLGTLSAMPVVSRLMSKYGPRGPTLGGFLLLSGACFLVGLVPNIIYITVDRLIQGFAWSAILIGTTIFVAKYSPNEKLAQAIAIYGSSFLVSFAVGPWFGEMIVSVWGGFQWLFLSVAAISVAAFAVGLLLDALPGDIEPEPGNLSSPALSGTLPIGAVFCLACGFGSIISFTADYVFITKLGTVTGFFYSLLFAGLFIRFICGEVLNRLTKHLAICVGSICQVGTFIGLAGLTSEWQLIPIGALFGVAHAIHNPTLQALVIERGSNTTTGVARYSAAYLLGVSVSTFGSGFVIAWFGYHAMYVVQIALTSLAMIFIVADFINTQTATDCGVSAGKLRGLSAKKLRRDRMDARFDDDPFWNRSGIEGALMPTFCRHSVVELFSSNAMTQPTAAALITESEILSYGWLNIRSNAIAARLQSLGIGRGAVVGLHLERTAGLLCAVLGVLKAGAAYLPINPAYPAERRAFMVEDSDAQFLLYDASTPLPMQNLEHQCTAVNIESIHNVESHRFLPTELASQDLAYLIYTSGSTGKPKSVEIGHEALANCVRSFADILRFRPTDRFAAVTSFSFDIAALELLLPLVVGGAVVLVDRQTGMDGRLLRAAICQHNVSVLQATPITWRLLLDACVPEDYLPIVAVCGGGVMTPMLARRLRNQCKKAFNVYGPTETTIWSTYYDLADYREGPAVPIGSPIANTSIHILDGDLNPTPQGAAGEICIGGAGLSRGYRNREELTAERFVHVAPFGRLYRTGDFGHLDESGLLYYHGRSDSQIKLRGHRIEIGEIEAVLAEHDDILDAVVVVSSAGDNDEDSARMDAFVIIRCPDALSTIREHVSAKLPEYMMPATIRALAEFPRLPNGKADRRRISEFAPREPVAIEPFVSGLTPVQTRIADIWKAVLKIPQVGPHDNFFRIGGDSLQALQIVLGLEEIAGELLYVGLIYKAPTIATFETLLRDNYPLTYAQLGGLEVSSGRSDVSYPNRHQQQYDQLRITIGSRPRPRPAVTSPARAEEAIFILCAPRSGSTLLRVMLAGNRALFAPPEMELLEFSTLRERRDCLSGVYIDARDGLVRAIMSACGLDAEEAKAFLLGKEEANISIQDLLVELAATIAPRKLVDKTTTYAIDIRNLFCAEQYVKNAKYIHLIRHPCGMIQSYVDAHIDQIFRHQFPGSPRDLAECIWRISNENVLTFLERIPRERWIRVHFEQLLAEPERQMRRLADFLEVPFETEMLQPYDGAERRMLDGMYQQSRMVGDPRFDRHSGINGSVADAWREKLREQDLSSDTQHLAYRCGYQINLGNPS